MKREFKRRIKIQRKGEVNKEKDLTIVYPFQRQGRLERKKKIHHSKGERGWRKKERRGRFVKG
jgi:hypothetical protein